MPQTGIGPKPCFPKGGELLRAQALMYPWGHCIQVVPQAVFRADDHRAHGPQRIVQIKAQQTQRFGHGLFLVLGPAPGPRVGLIVNAAQMGKIKVGVNLCG